MGEKKQFRVVAVSRPNRPIWEYAQELEHQMNELANDGYDIGLREDPGGVILIASLEEDDDEAQTGAPRTLGELLSRFGMQPPPEHSARTGALLRKFAEVTNLRVCDVSKADNVRACISGYSAKELAEAAEVFEKAAEQHKDHDDCSAGAFLKAVAQVVKQAAHENLQ
jgi:hypothetical protein